MEKIVISENEYFNRAMKVINKLFVEGTEKETELPVLFSVFSTIMENISIIWKRIAKKREADGLYEFTKDEFEDANHELYQATIDVAFSSDRDLDVGIIFSLRALSAASAIRLIGKAIAGEPDDSDD